MNNKVEKFLRELELDFDIENFVNIPKLLEVSSDKVFAEIVEQLDENDRFNSEFIGCIPAIEFLTENDPSLRTTFGIVSEWGFETGDLSSEMLAGLLGTQMNKEALDELESDIEEFFERLEFITSIAQELDECEKIPMFEIKVKKPDEDEEWFIFNISINIEKEIIKTGSGDEYCEYDLDDCFTLDEHLEGLYSELIEKLMECGYEILN